MKATTAPARTELLVGLVVVVGLGALLANAQWREDPLDDPDPAYQRPGFLDAGAPAAPAPALTVGAPRPGRRAVLFFIRPAVVSPLTTALAGAPSLLEIADVVLVSPVPTPEPTSFATVVDPEGRLAALVHLRTPRDKGPPVGYAIVDTRGLVRYRTLDPAVADQLAEVETMVRATP